MTPLFMLCIVCVRGRSFPWRQRGQRLSDTPVFLARTFSSVVINCKGDERDHVS